MTDTALDTYYKVAVFINHYSIGKSSPVICLLDCLAGYYARVDVYVKDVWCTKASVLDKKNISIIELKSYRHGLPGVYDKISALFTKTQKIIADYSNYICIDPHGMILCNELFPTARPYYFSLELYFRNNHFNLPYPRSIIKKDRILVKNIRGLIIQSEEREKFFRQEYDLSPIIPSFFLPVTYLQSSYIEKSGYLREKYSIPRNKKLALHLGGIQEYYSCIEIGLAFSEMHDWVLIFHGYHFGEYIDRFRRILRDRNIVNVIISDDYFEFIEDMDPLLMSSDVGIAWYNDMGPNFTTSGKSSGKISAYMRFGLPVIANRYPSTISAIEKTGCGVCIDTFNGFRGALDAIIAKYDTFSGNCIREYDAVYHFENYREGLISFLDGDQR